MHIRIVLLFLSIPLFVCAPVRGFSSALGSVAAMAAEAVGESPGGGKSSPGISLGGSAAADAEAPWQKIGKRLRPHFGEIVDSIIVRGNTHTKRITIVREMTTRQGEPLEEHLIKRDMSFIRGMGYFSDADISIERVSTGRCRITVYIIERPGLFMRFPYPVVNYDFEKGLSYGVRWRIKNFRGLGEEFRLIALKRREKEHGGDIAWKVPWLMGKRLQMNLMG